MPRPLPVSADSVRAFRARRSHLSGPGAADPVACAADLVGAQAQIEGCALHALALRTRGRPTADAVQALILQPPHALVRTWGQRDTLHLYDARDWPTVIGARPVWVQSGRRGGMPPDELLERARQVFAEAGRPLLRSDLFDIVPDAYVDELRGHQGGAGDPLRFAATRLVWRLATEGHIAFAHKEGSQQAYVHRHLWHARLDWPALGPDEAATMLTRRYLAVFGPATVQDVAHHFGGRVSDARRWVERLGPELVPIDCEGRKGLLALEADVDPLRAAPEHGPARLLPGYDTMLMAHADKRWILPDKVEEPLVWKKAAAVAATVIAEGRVAATWTQGTTSKGLTVEVRPMQSWRPSLRTELEQDAIELAAHHQLPLVDLRVGPEA